VREWAPPLEDEEEAEVAYISYISSAGPGNFKISLPEDLLLPQAY
jgi:hypothetical protein